MSGHFSIPTIICRNLIRHYHIHAHYRSYAPCSRRLLHRSGCKIATPLPLTATGPPPSAPRPLRPDHDKSVEQRQRRADLVKEGQEIRARQGNKQGIQKRFWQDVHVIRSTSGRKKTLKPREKAENEHDLAKDMGESTRQDNRDPYIVQLDNRPIKNPMTKASLTIPATKPFLATGIAIEWESMTSAQQALKPHLIPLTSLASRAEALALEDERISKEIDFVSLGVKGEGIRYEIINTLLRYLDTDTLLCWAPETSPRTAFDSANVDSELKDDATHESQATPEADESGTGSRTLRELQINTALPIMAYLTQHIWPGADLCPTLDNGSILPRSQPAHTRAVLKGWLATLPAYELVGLERATLAGKSLCVGARLICEWSENLGLTNLRKHPVDPKAAADQPSHKPDESVESSESYSFGIEAAARACSLEVSWQTRQWGEVEDTHDVDKEDVKRQLGSVILLVSGTSGS